MHLPIINICEDIVAVRRALCVGWGWVALQGASGGASLSNTHHPTPHFPTQLALEKKAITEDSGAAEHKHTAAECTYLLAFQSAAILRLVLVFFSVTFVTCNLCVAKSGGGVPQLCASRPASLGCLFRWGAKSCE